MKEKSIEMASQEMMEMSVPSLFLPLGLQASSANPSEKVCVKSLSWNRTMTHGLTLS
jgi:hypothetical protein